MDQAVIKFAHSEWLVKNDGQSASSEIRNDHRLADQEPLGKMLRANNS